MRSACPQVAETTYRCPDAAFGFFHDYLVTENYYVVLDNPTRMDFRKLLVEYTTGRACIAECIYLDPARRMKARHACIYPVPVRVLCTTTAAAALGCACTDLVACLRV